MEQHKAQTPGNAELQRALDAWTEQFEADEERRRQEALQAMEDEGWTVVQRHKVGRAAARQPLDLRATKDPPVTVSSGLRCRCLSSCCAYICYV